jgi:hypothetical protein
MTQLGRFKHSVLIEILQPTWGGSLAAAAFAIIMLLIGRLPHLSHQLNELYIPQAINNVQHDIGRDIVSLLTRGLHGYANDVLLVGFWVVVGIIIYSLLHGLGSIFLDLEESLEERNYLWPAYADRNKELRAFITKLGFRLAILILLILYVFVVMRRSMHHLNHVLDQDVSTEHLFVHYLIFMIGAWLLAQGFVILIRLLALRPRLF